MKKLILTLMCMFTVNVNAAIITIGSYDIDEAQFLDAASIVSGTSPQPASNVIGSNFNTFSTISGSAILFGSFDDNIAFNGSGYDIFIFELAAPESPNLSLSIGGTTAAGALLETVIGHTGAIFQINIYGYDLSDFGLGTNDILSSGLFISAGASDSPNISAIAAVNSVGFTSVNSPGSVLIILLSMLFLSCSKGSLNRTKLRANNL